MGRRDVVRLDQRVIAMAKIGPSFAEELTAAGVVDRRFTWGPESGKVDFHPDVPDSERAKVEAVLAAHDGPLSEARHQALEATRVEASARIAPLFGQPPASLDLAFAEINALAEAVEIMEKGGSALPEERVALEALKDLRARTKAILQVRRAAKAALLLARSVEDVQAVKVGWPEE
jgi:hypothetical protein